ncbi:PatB family C-S lyase [Nitratifractor sp.]|uniref:MalY/PatB family protein n=1 Tax=Nitratifractor sp. TaxID=2268144 RepID=UPI0025D3436B|nr:PatB family C-S lyase [Nitratifractor sp.]
MSSEASVESPRYVDRRGTGASKWDALEERFGRSDLIPLWVADGDFSTPKAVQEALRRRAEHPVYGYTEYSEGFYDAVIGWVRRRFGWEIEREWIVPEHGVVISLNLAIEAYSAPGDGVIVQTPIYPPFLKAVKRHKRRLLENRLIVTEEGCRIDFDDLEAKAAEAKLLLLCSPHNPSTRAWSEAELSRLADIAERHDLIVVSDEIHADIVYARRHLPFAALPGMAKRSLVLHAPSKTFHIAGLNTSFAILPDDSLRRRYRLAHERAGLDNGNCFGIVALEAAYREGDTWLEAMLKIYEENIAYVRTFLLEHTPKIRPLPVEATYLIWLDCRAMELDDDALQRFFVDEAHLALNPGVSFGEAGRGFMRLNVATSRENLEEAMRRLSAAYQKRGEG